MSRPPAYTPSASGASLLNTWGSTDLGSPDFAGWRAIQKSLQRAEPAGQRCGRRRNDGVCLQCCRAARLRVERRDARPAQGQVLLGREACGLLRKWFNALRAPGLTGVPSDRSSSLGWLAGVPSDRSSSLGWLAGVPSDRSSSLGWLARDGAP